MIAEAERHAVCCELVHDVARALGEVMLQAAGASMIPAIWPGDLLTVRPCAVSSLRSGQVILFRRGDKLFAHRIQRINDDNIVTRGDSVREFDPPVAECEVVGRVECIRRGNRAVAPTLTLWNGIASFLLRRSDIVLRGTLFLSRRLRRSWEAQPVFSFASTACQTQREC